MASQRSNNSSSGERDVQALRPAELPPEPVIRQGFLPIYANAFDRIFISVVVFVALHLLWMRFIEFFLPLWICTILAVIIGIIIVRWG